MSPDAARLTVVHCDTPFEILWGSYRQQRFAPHVHETFAVGVIERGAARCHYRGEDVVHGPGDIVMMEPGEVHTGEPACAEGWSYRMLYLPRDLMARFASGDGVEPRFGRSAIADPDLASRLVRLHHTLERNGDRLRQSSCLADALHRLTARHARSSVRTEALAGSTRLTRVRDYLHEHFAEPVTLAELARIAELSAFHLIRAFRRRYGVPPHTYLLLVRIDRAKAMLQRGARVSDVAMDTGFSDQAHLTRRFRSVVGVPPGRYANARAARTRD